MSLAVLFVSGAFGKVVLSGYLSFLANAIMFGKAKIIKTNKE
jgi:hypothetical protein